MFPVTGPRGTPRLEWEKGNVKRWKALMRPLGQACSEAVRTDEVKMGLFKSPCNAFGDADRIHTPACRLS